MDKEKRRQRHKIRRKVRREKRNFAKLSRKHVLTVVRAAPSGQSLIWRTGFFARPGEVLRWHVCNFLLTLATLSKRRNFIKRFCMYRRLFGSRREYRGVFRYCLRITDDDDEGDGNHSNYPINHPLNIVYQNETSYWHSRVGRNVAWPGYVTQDVVYHHMDLLFSFLSV